jgi:DNA-binding response OmpR family regulator
MSKKILVAEDDQAILEVIKIILEGEGYSVVSAAKEGKIYSLITEHNPSLILLDIWLSGLDGGKIARNLKNKKETKNLPIVMISANNETDKITRESGADDFLLKPFDINDLLKIVKKYTDK